MSEQSEEMRLQRMDLVQLPDIENDEAVGEENFTHRATLYGELKTSPLTDKKVFNSTKTAFETTEYTGERQCVPCYLPVPILKIHGKVRNKASLDKKSYKGTPAIFTWAMEETAEWCKEQITFDTIKGRDMMQDMKVASNPETYSVPDYSEKIPSHVINAEDKYKRLYLEETLKSHKDLKFEDIKINYIMLQCNFPMHRDSETSQHYRKVHLLKNGANDLKKRDVIKVDTAMEFKIEDLTQFESSV